MQIDTSTLQFLPPLEIFKQNIILYLPRLASALLLLVIGLKSQPIFKSWLKSFFNKLNYDESLKKFLYSLFGISYKIIILLMAISIAGIETTSIVAALGAAGFAVGLALQGSMSNFASGILILTLKQIKVGEFVEVGTSSGTVHKIEIFNTILLTTDNKTVIIPNSEITNKIITNYSRQKLRRIDLEIGIDYTSDIKKAKNILAKAVELHKNLVISNDEKNTIIGVSSLGNSSIILQLLVWCNSKDYMTLKRGLLEDIKYNLDKEKILISYPTVQIKK